MRRDKLPPKFQFWLSIASIVTIVLGVGEAMADAEQAYLTMKDDAEKKKEVKDNE